MTMNPDWLTVLEVTAALIVANAIDGKEAVTAYKAMY